MVSGILNTLKPKIIIIGTSHTCAFHTSQNLADAIIWFFYEKVINPVSSDTHEAKRIHIHMQ